MALFTFFLVVVGFGQGIFLYRTDQGTHKAADAAKDSADIAKDTLVATNRPWISIQVIGNSGIDWEDRGARISVKFKLTNIGKSPATNVYFQAASVLPKIGEPTIPIKAMADFAADIRRRRGLSEIAGEAYFPDQPYEVGIAMLIDRGQSSLDFSKRSDIQIYCLGSLPAPVIALIPTTNCGRHAPAITSQS